MSRVITFSRVFPAYHPKKGEPTFFVEKLLKSFESLKIPILEIDQLAMDSIGLVDDVYENGHPKHHTVRAGNRWKAGDYFSPRVWGGKPYRSGQVILTPDVPVKKTWSLDIINDKVVINGLFHCLIYDDISMEKFAKNDGLSAPDLLDWFKYPKPTTDNQIICWNEHIEYPCKG